MLLSFPAFRDFVVRGLLLNQMVLTAQNDKKGFPPNGTRHKQKIFL